MRASARAVKRLFARNLSIATAESCTGGMIASELVSFSGISSLFFEGFVTYSNESKMRRLGVRESTLAQHGAVSEETAREMALGARDAAGADIGLASTGIAGPDGGSEEKPVGLVYLSCAFEDRVVTRRYIFPGNRTQVRMAAVRAAFALLDDCVGGKIP